MAAALARLGVLSASEYVEAVDTATLSMIAYYGAIFPVGRKASEKIDVAKRRGLTALGHAGGRTARWLMHALEPVGLGMAISWPHAAAALTVEVDKAYNADACTPARVAVACRTAKEHWRLGWRPTRSEPAPLAFNPWNSAPVLAEEGIVEAVLKYKLEAGIETRLARGDGAACALSAGYKVAPGEGATASVWARPGRTWGWRLARLGGVQRRDFHTVETSYDPASGVHRASGDGGRPASLARTWGAAGTRSAAAGQGRS